MFGPHVCGTFRGSRPPAVQQGPKSVWFFAPRARNARPSSAVEYRTVRTSRRHFDANNTRPAESHTVSRSPSRTIPHVLRARLRAKQRCDRFTVVRHRSVQRRRVRPPCPENARCTRPTTSVRMRCFVCAAQRWPSVAYTENIFVRGCYGQS
jgi:hypothetical protein